NQRLAPLPMEPNAIVVAPDPDTGGIKVWASTQVPFGLRDGLAGLLDLRKADVRVIAPAVGGGFGAKAALFSEFAVVAALARRLGRPVRWLETRSENFVSMMHGRGQVQEVALGAGGDGKLVGLQARVIADAGAYPNIGVLLPGLTGLMSAGVYRMPKVDFASSVRLTTPRPCMPIAAPADPRPRPWSSAPWTCLPPSWEWTRLSCDAATCSSPTSSRRRR